MRRVLMAAVVTVTLTWSASAQGTLPELDAVKWYNTPPLALEQMQGKAILVEVFRTW